MTGDQVTNAAFRADWNLVQAELARLDVAIGSGPLAAGIGWERALVRQVCLGRLGIAHAAAVLRQEALFALDHGDSPWYRPGHPPHSWVNECNRMHFLAGVAGLTGYRLPMPDEALHIVRRARAEYLRDPFGDRRPEWLW